MFEKILVPLDGSKAAEMVIPYAEEISTSFSSQLILASVSEFLRKGAGHLYHDYMTRIMEQVQQQLEEQNPGKITQTHSELLIGRPAEEIIRYADEINAGLIAMTSRGSSIPGPWPLGSTAAKILRATSKPILLIRAPAGDIALSRKKLINKVLVPLDFSTLGSTAIPYAEILGQSLNAELVLLHAIEPELKMFPYYDARLPPISDKERAIARSNILTSLEETAKPLKEKGLIVSTTVVSGYAAESILDYAKSNSIDLIAMSTHGEKGIGRWVFGSVTDKVLHTGDTAVLVTRRIEVETKA
jgi:nucleotide-binding universal stress UspA family protein